jgi:hypothetical protein
MGNYRLTHDSVISSCDRSVVSSRFVVGGVGMMCRTMAAHGGDGIFSS